jgi:uroporphyrinogen-III synthase
MTQQVQAGQVAPPAVVVTRPEPDASAWVAQLAGSGIAAVALPLITIRPSRAGAAVADQWAQLDRYQALMFVSAQAVGHFFAARPTAPAGQMPHDTWRAWATGTGTARALLQAGVAPARIDMSRDPQAQMDSEALWAQVQAQLPPAPAAPVSRVLIVRGSDAHGRMAGRDWLAQQLQSRGVAVDFAVAYERHAPDWSPAQRAQVQGYAQAVWVFSSSEAITNLQALMPAQHWHQARAVATHPRIAQAARLAGFGVVCESRPGLDAVLASIKSLQ